MLSLPITEKNKGLAYLANPLFYLNLYMVPRDRIELPTRGFSVAFQKNFKDQ
jgi:hypothetical protein